MLKKIWAIYFVCFVSCFLFSQTKLPKLETLKKAKYYYAQKNWKKSEVYFKKAVFYFSNDPKIKAFIYNRLGLIQAKNKRYKKSLYYFQNSIQIKKFYPEKFNAKSLAKTLFHIALVYERLNQKERANQYYNEYYSILEKPAVDKNIIFQAKLSTLARSNHEIPLTSSNEHTILAEDTLRLRITPGGYLWGYKWTAGGLEPLDKFSFEPKDFVKNLKIIDLPLKGIQEDTMWFWFFSKKNIKNRNRIRIIQRKVFSEKSLMSLARKGILEEQSQSYPVGKRIKNDLKLFIFSSLTEYKVAEIRVLMAPIQIELIGKERGIITEDDPLRAREKFAIRISNYADIPFYVYGFHYSKSSSIQQLYPTSAIKRSIAPSQTIILPSASKYYTLDDVSGWEYQFFFYKKEAEKPKKIKQWLIEFVGKNNLNRLFYSKKNNQMFLKGDVGFLFGAAKNDPEFIEPNFQNIKFQDVVVLKFYKFK